MIQKNPNRQRYAANFQEAFYWERVNRSLGWLGQTDEEQRQRQAKLRELTVGIAGCGGIGGMVASRLGRLGIGRIKLADPDSFDISNHCRPKRLLDRFVLIDKSISYV